MSELHSWQAIIGSLLPANPEAGLSPQLGDCTGQRSAQVLFSPLLLPALCLISLVICVLLQHVLFPSAGPKSLRPVFIPSTKSLVLFPQVFS